MFLTISKINNKRKIWNETHPTNHHRETTSLAHDSQSLFLSLLNLVLKYSYRSLSGKKSRNIYNVIQNIYWKHKISNIESEIPLVKNRRNCRNLISSLRSKNTRIVQNLIITTNKISKCKSVITSKQFPKIRKFEVP